MEMGRAPQMEPAITEWCVGPALVAGPQIIGKTVRRSFSAKATEDRQSGDPTSDCIVPAQTAAKYRKQIL
jgi:hypothetical protein